MLPSKALVFFVAGALALSCVAASAAGGCSLRTLDQCDNTNQLIWNRVFEASLRHFFGHRRANYLYNGDPLVSNQAIAVLGGPPDTPERIGDLWRFTACRAHSCPEKGAAVLEPDGRLIAVAILHSPCAEPNRPTDCSSHLTLSIFIRPSNQSASVIANLSSWGRAMVNGEYHPPSLPADQLDQVEVVRL